MQVTLRSHCIGSLALKGLSNGNSVPAGQVVNVFSNSFYIKTRSDELVFVTNRPLRSPITINLEATPNLEQLVKPLDLVRVNERGLRLGTDNLIELSIAELYRDRAEAARELRPGFMKIDRPLHLISFILRIIDTAQSVLDRDSLAHPRLVDFVSDGVMLLRQPGKESRFREAALKVVGSGSGFTPSGDDALGGFLSTYNSFARAVRRAPVFLDSELLEEKTSWISAKLLDYMQRLVLDEQLRWLIDSANKNEDDLVTALETLLHRGHTSGIDIAVGSVLALSLIRDVAFETEDTKTIAHALGL